MSLLLVGLLENILPLQDSLALVGFLVVFLFFLLNLLLFLLVLVLNFALVNLLVWWLPWLDGLGVLQLYALSLGDLLEVADFSTVLY